MKLVCFAAKVAKMAKMADNYFLCIGYILFQVFQSVFVSCLSECVSHNSLIKCGCQIT